MDMGRTSVNVIGNCLASVVIAKWEGEFDQEKAENYGNPAYQPIGLKKRTAIDFYNKKNENQ